MGEALAGAVPVARRLLGRVPFAQAKYARAEAGNVLSLPLTQSGRKG